MERTTTGMMYNGTAVSKDSMQPGDIILWDTSFGNNQKKHSLYKKVNVFYSNWLPK